MNQYLLGHLGKKRNILYRLISNQSINKPTSNALFLSSLNNINNTISSSTLFQSSLNNSSSNSNNLIQINQYSSSTTSKRNHRFNNKKQEVFFDQENENQQQQQELILDEDYEESSNNSDNSRTINSKKDIIFDKPYSRRNALKRNKYGVVEREFKEMGLKEEILKGIKDLQWDKPTDIQNHVIPFIFKGRNVVFSSQTGTGKSGAYILPIIQKLSGFKDYLMKSNYGKDKILKHQQEEQDKPNSQDDDNDDNQDDFYVKEEEQEFLDDQDGEKEIEYYEKLKRYRDVLKNKEYNDKDPLALILVPSKELAIQVTKDIQQLCKYLVKEDGKTPLFRIQSFFGGVGEANQIEILEKGIDIMIATPGRLLQLCNKDVVSFHQVRFTVIDEFDKLFNLGFFPDTKELFDLLPLVKNKNRQNGMQTILGTATIKHKEMDKMITRFAPGHLLVNHNKELVAPTNVKQFFYFVNYHQKTSLLKYFLGRKGKTSLKGLKTIVFARTQQRVEKLAQRLHESGIKCLYIHADMSVSQRKDIIDQFQQNLTTQGEEIKILISTDVVARGIHIDNVEAIINFDVPHVAEDYLHRIGRAGRLGASGKSLTFISPEKLIFKVGERTVGLNEKHLMLKVQDSFGVKVKIDKVPGTFNTGIELKSLEDKSAANTSADMESIEKLAVAEILMKKKIIEPIKSPLNKDGIPRVKFNPNAKVRDSKMSKIIIDRKGQLYDLPALTDFKEGQYENVMNEFDKNRAKSRGISFEQKKVYTPLPSSIVTPRQKLKLNLDNLNDLDNIKGLGNNKTRYKFDDDDVDIDDHDHGGDNDNNDDSKQYGKFNFPKDSKPKSTSRYSKYNNKNFNKRK
ncbi:hypothetical protein CYY_001854 [Polysphondylium violaceum]|uniref:RNA helicase n=1 Tax=Polysphondylium violaceum TaxID=133409 RepID=A0A8J4Q8M3_9MYCE|nr:hypothetical protein CYY_001854 [Polysphondylium violaceum]